MCWYLEDSRTEALEGVEESRQIYEMPRGVAVERGWAGELLRSPLLQNQRWIQISVAESAPQTHTARHLDSRRQDN